MASPQPLAWVGFFDPVAHRKILVPDWYTAWMASFDRWRKAGPAGTE
jgi:hypothetical protein